MPMRYFILSTIIFCILIIGCAPEEPTFAVGLYNLTNEDYYNPEDDEVHTRLTFFLMNQEQQDLDCYVVLEIDGSEHMTKRGRLGVVESGKSKKGGFDIKLPEGNSNINLEPLCIPILKT